MKTIYAFAAGLLCAAQFSTAAVWRLNNSVDAHVDFTDIQVAINEATVGDTIYVEGSDVEYESATTSEITLNKKLHLIGPGYLLGENDTLQQFTKSAIIGEILAVKVGAEGSIIEGLKFTDQLRVSAGSVTVRNNFLVTNTYFGFDIGVFPDIVFTQNYMSSVYVYKGATGIIRNNIIKSGIEMKSDAVGPIQILNNTFIGTATSAMITAINSKIANNIMIGTIKDNASNLLENNFASNVRDDYPLNFVDTTSIDGKWQLLPDSPFYTGANDGGQCGAFGGATPYQLSGLPQIPQIYQVVTSGTATATTGMNVTLKINTAK